MNDGFIKVATATPEIKVADTAYNAEKIIEIINNASSLGVKLLVLPELCITGYTCGDLFLNSTLINGAEIALEKIIKATAGKEMAVAVGFPMLFRGKLFDCAAIACDGQLLGIIPKTVIVNHGELCEGRYFSPAPDETEEIVFLGASVPFGKNILFRSLEIPEFCFAAEISADLLSPFSPSVIHATAGALIVANLSASSETVGKKELRCTAAKEQSRRLICGYVYSDAGEGESTTDAVYSGHSVIYENGVCLKENPPFSKELLISEIDVVRLSDERKKNSVFPITDDDGYAIVEFSVPVSKTEITRKIARMPFVPEDNAAKVTRCEEILSIQARGLKKRLEHVYAKCAVIAVSGGLDSTLALLVAVKAMDLMGRPHSDIIAVSMPGFGTTKRTKSNAQILCEELGVSYREIPIADAVKIHFRDIGHDENVCDVTYENSQARERTQIVMDIANKNGGILIGTGDLSELALGWATYNGDHMSMYGVNGGVPKTLIRHIVGYCADNSSERLFSVLNDILATPVSPELLPAKDGEISQKTEDLVGPYELHDFFLYYFMRHGMSPKKIFRLAVLAFEGEYDKETIHKWLKNFVRRFFMQQFKRSCLPDGPKVGSVGVSPRGDLKMPSDAVATLWMDVVDSIKL